MSRNIFPYFIIRHQDPSAVKRPVWRRTLASNFHREWELKIAWKLCTWNLQLHADSVRWVWHDVAAWVQCKCGRRVLCDCDVGPYWGLYSVCQGATLLAVEHWHLRDRKLAHSYRFCRFPQNAELLRSVELDSLSVKRQSRVRRYKALWTINWVNSIFILVVLTSRAREGAFD